MKLVGKQLDDIIEISVEDVVLEPELIDEYKEEEMRELLKRGSK